jgi:hypothetical protein
LQKIFFKTKVQTRKRINQFFMKEHLNERGEQKKTKTRQIKKKKFKKITERNEFSDFKNFT